MDFENDSGAVSFWPSVSDLFMTLFILAVVLQAALYLVFVTGAEESGFNKGEARIKAGDVRIPVNDMKEALEEPLDTYLRETQSAKEVVTALQDTSVKVVKKLSFQGRLEDFQAELEQKKKEIILLQKKVAGLEKENVKLKYALKQKGAENNEIQTDLDEALKFLRDRPEMIVVKPKPGSKEHFFPTLRATVSPEFREDLSTDQFNELSEQILKRNANPLTEVDTIEVVGHTDGEAISGSKAGEGNLDRLLPEYLANKRVLLSEFKPGSNNDLGLLRSLAIREEWKLFVGRQDPDQQAQLSKVQMRCYSAGQTLPKFGNLNFPGAFRQKEDSFRRIEMRLTKLND